MKFLLIMQVNPAAIESLTEAEQKSIMNGHEDFMKTVRESGEFVATQALADPANSVTVRGTGGVPAVTDGPFLEAKEFMGGYYLLDVESKERAVELAKLIPDAKFSGLAIEVRPVMFEAGFDM
ncbi:YciI family protein [Actinophytocola sp.]|uniref:YciI family protein n=1 Tax=Actinophytocola sp. TaxID=1872138 RepID=UPI003D6C3D44